MSHFQTHSVDWLKILIAILAALTAMGWLPISPEINAALIAVYAAASGSHGVSKH